MVTGPMALGRNGLLRVATECGEKEEGGEKDQEGGTGRGKEPFTTLPPLFARDCHDC